MHARRALENVVGLLRRQTAVSIGFLNPACTAPFTCHSLIVNLLCVVVRQVESWIMEHGTEWVGESWDELKYIRQVGSVAGYTAGSVFRLVCMQKLVQRRLRFVTLSWQASYLHRGQQ